LIKIFLSSNCPAAQKLKHAEAVAIGFVDGNLELIFVRS
jgi:hypothetical protein